MATVEAKKKKGKAAGGNTGSGGDDVAGEVGEGRHRPITNLNNDQTEKLINFVKVI